MTLSVVHSDTSAGLESLRDRLPDYAKDTRLNLGTVLTPEGASDLTPNQIAGIALASAYATRSRDVIDAMIAHTDTLLNEAEKQAARAAASVMAMNNIYYRFLHLAGDAEFKTMPAKLRMNVIGQPGIAKADFELYSLAISAINGCGMCIEAHTHELVKAGVSKLGIQSAVRIASVLNAAAQSLI
jgi:alkyl hydroperoxide reductase subunit D